VIVGRVCLSFGGVASVLLYATGSSVRCCVVVRRGAQIVGDLTLIPASALGAGISVAHGQPWWRQPPPLHGASSPAVLSGSTVAAQYALTCGVALDRAGWPATATVARGDLFTGWPARWNLASSPRGSPGQANGLSWPLG